MLSRGSTLERGRTGPTVSSDPSKQEALDETYSVVAGRHGRRSSGHGRIGPRSGRASGREPAGQQLAAHDRRHRPRRRDADRLERLLGRATPISYAYQWQRCNSSGSSCGSISNATNQNYVASSGDVGRTIRVEVTATNADGTNQALSGATGCDRCRSATRRRTRSSRIRPGRPQDGQTITVDNGSWSGCKPITFTYQWQSCTAVRRSAPNIAGATGPSYPDRLEPGRLAAARDGHRHQLGREDLGLLEPDGRRPREGDARPSTRACR